MTPAPETVSLPAPGPNAISIEDVREASKRIRPLAKQTPVLTSRTFDREFGVRAFFKAEMFQTGGAFKIRGATNFAYSIPKADLSRGVVAFSSGNHAQAVSIAAEELGIPATIVMPEDAPKAKLDATRSHGARIITYDRHTGDREAIGRQVSADTGATLIPPYDHPWIMAGAGTTALEIFEEVPEVDALLVCLGGGGLLAGCSVVAKALRPEVRVFGVEPEAGNDWYLSFRKGEPVGIGVPDTIADGLRTQKPGSYTWPVVQANVEEVLLVSDDEIRAAQEYLRSRLKVVVEPSGAVGVAATMFGKLPNDIRSAAIVLSGGNY
jgi:threonine dehydratase